MKDSWQENRRRREDENVLSNRSFVFPLFSRWYLRTHLEEGSACLDALDESKRAFLLILLLPQKSACLPACLFKPPHLSLSSSPLSCLSLLSLSPSPHTSAFAMKTTKGIPSPTQCNEIPRKQHARLQIFTSEKKEDKAARCP